MLLTWESEALRCKAATGVVGAEGEENPLRPRMTTGTTILPCTMECDLCECGRGA